MNALILLGLLGSERMLAANHMGLLIVALRKRWRSEVFYPLLSPPPFLSFFFCLKRRPTYKPGPNWFQMGLLQYKGFQCVWAKADCEGPCVLPVQLCNCTHLIRNSPYCRSPELPCWCPVFVSQSLNHPVLLLAFFSSLFFSIVFRELKCMHILMDENKEDYDYLGQFPLPPFLDLRGVGWHVN